jgi:threonine/homoserine/homoserine lactone efflux protein
MFEYSLSHWATFFLAAFLLNMTPGPDMAFIFAQSLKNGKKAGFVALAGIWSGAFVHVLMAAFGLSVILATSATAFTVVKWLGAAYLIYLGIQALRAKTGEAPLSAVSNANTLRAVFRQGVLVAILNPKVALFFLAFLPQFVVPGSGPEGAQLFLHGVLIIAVAGIFEPPLILLASRLSRAIENGASWTRWMDRGLGLLFIGLGLRLFFSEQS